VYDPLTLHYAKIMAYINHGILPHVSLPISKNVLRSRYYRLIPGQQYQLDNPSLNFPKRERFDEILDHLAVKLRVYQKHGKLIHAQG
jgi:hypothetical protein